LVENYFDRCEWVNYCTIAFFVANIIYFFIGIYFSIYNIIDKNSKSFYPDKPKVEIPQEKELGK
jgi:hypothetical protein